MVGLTGRQSPATSRIGHALRLATICLLVVLTTGVLPVAGRYFEDIRGCDQNTCTRCDCKHRRTPTSVRAPCPCCDSHPASTSHVTAIDPALLPGSARGPVALETFGLLTGAGGHGPSFTPSVPHPPPRTVTPA